MNKYNRIFSPNLWLPFNFGDPNERYASFLRRGKPELKTFLDNLTLYESITIPTNDFLSLTVLLGVFPEYFITHLLESEKLRFQRIKGAIVYRGGGIGLQSIHILDKKKQNTLPLSSDLESSIKWSIEGLQKNISKSIIDKVIKNTTEIDASTFVPDIIRSVKHQILESNTLRSYFPKEHLDFENLEGLKDTEVRIYGGIDAKSKSRDSVDILLRISHAILELNLFSDSNCKDISTIDPVFEVLESPLIERLKNYNTNFLTLKEIENVPDFSEKLISDHTKLKSFLKTIDTKSASEFRSWYNNTSFLNEKIFIREWINILTKEHGIDSTSGKFLRFLIPTAIGFTGIIGTIAAPVLSFFDSFLLNSFFKNRPKIFIDELRKLNGNKKTNGD